MKTMNRNTGVGRVLGIMGMVLAVLALNTLFQPGPIGQRVIVYGCLAGYIIFTLWPEIREGRGEGQGKSGSSPHAGQHGGDA